MMMNRWISLACMWLILLLAASFVQSFSVERRRTNRPMSLPDITTIHRRTWRMRSQNEPNENRPDILQHDWALSSSRQNSNELMPLQRGSTVALITPFLPDTGAVDVAGLRALIEYHLAAGTDNVCLLGTTGEASVLSRSERARVLHTAVALAKGRVPLLVGCGTIDPTQVRELTEQAYDCGADAALVVTPYYVKPPQRGLVRHFTDLATVSPLPVVMYNVPGRTAVDMADASMAIAAMHENIVGVKDATGQLARVAALRQQLQEHQVNTDDFLLLSGDDATSVDFCLLGGDGCISVTANVAARAMHESMMAALQGDRAVAAAVNAPLTALHTQLFCESNPMPVKYAARRLGLIGSSYCRPPLDMLASNYEAVVDDALRQAGLWPDATAKQ